MFDDAEFSAVGNGILAWSIICLRCIFLVARAVYERISVQKDVVVGPGPSVRSRFVVESGDRTREEPELRTERIGAILHG